MRDICLYGSLSQADLSGSRSPKAILAGGLMANVSAVPVTLITDAEREFLRGEKDVEDPEQYRRTIRYRVRQRAEQYPSDLMLLQEEGHDDLVALFYGQIVQDIRLRSDLRELQQSIDTLVRSLAAANPDLDVEEIVGEEGGSDVVVEHETGDGDDEPDGMPPE